MVYVYCEMRIDGRGRVWAVFQERQNGLLDFYQGRNDYKLGFAQLTAEFWQNQGVDGHYTQLSLQMGRMGWIGRE